jgi:hypothetical protein
MYRLHLYLYRDIKKYIGYIAQLQSHKKFVTVTASLLLTINNSVALCTLANTFVTNFVIQKLKLSRSYFSKELYF